MCVCVFVCVCDYDRTKIVNAAIQVYRVLEKLSSSYLTYTFYYAVDMPSMLQHEQTISGEENAPTDYNYGSFWI